ncbi:hypothetical protein ACFPME_05650 [Rhodanobacter umsongensis]|uniref:Uncharacterized protein n=1 Tax=Rhodanobacter umsongensis TaxID=633153 RepID=A0ABW0JJD2_9GAMM
MKSFIVTLLAALAGASTPANAAMPAATAYLAPAFHAGDRFDNVFSRTIAYRASGYDESVRRISGSASYTVLDSATSQPRLHIDYRYDGAHQGSGAVEFRDGGATSCFDGKCTPNTDASGLAWNPRLWGKPPATLRVGQSWSVRIAEPWELGPAGTQKVTVIALDPSSQRITLLRDGSGAGAYLGDKLETTLTRGGQSWPVTVEPGRSHWYGYTTFRAGVVVSDELMVERPVTLVSDKLGRISASEREYILLNAMPPASGGG